MKIDKLKERLRPNRPMTTVSLRIPEDVLEDLKRIAPLLGFSSYEALIRAYIGQGLRVDLERLESNVEITTFVDSLRRQGVDDETIAVAIAEAQEQTKTEQNLASSKDFLYYGKKE
jgi:hypothetical protein